ncbi:hypothetical protein WS67_09800 [Burkholderia singularis]|uniref:Terpene synthase n=1 Tax=Burkholderia singularis TaxID=1503053 RepID=A0A103E4C2_9BURK|nr:hypothetical protein [Burkholderia singularis]KVE28123.1 hypothetical protein WS67_09800 [Burkholderia singularis]
MTGNFRLPPLPLPIEPKVHPHFNLECPAEDRFEAVTLEYADRFKLYHSKEQRARMRNTENSRLAAWMYPHGSDELLQIGSDFVLWAFAFDDEYCDEGPLSNDPVLFIQKAGEILRAIDSPEDPPCNDDKYAMAARDMRQRLDRYAKPVQVARFVEAFRWYVTAEILKITNLKPSLSDFLVQRLYSGGGWAFPILVHVVADIDITPEEYEDRRVRAISEMLAMLTVLDPELYAYPKEIARAVNDKEHNLIQIMCRDHQCSLEEGIRHCYDFRWRIISLFLRLRDDVMKDASPGLRAYIETFALYWAGSITWVCGNNRYYSVDGLVQTGLVSGGELTFDCPPESFESIGVPSFEWWWEYDPARRAGFRREKVAAHG